MKLQKVKPFDHPPSIDALIDSHRMTVKYKGFSVTSVKLVNGYFEANEEPQTLSNLQQHARASGMTVVRVWDTVVFRKLMKSLEETTEIMRASGDAVCEVCNFPFKDHPIDNGSSSFLNVLCNGRRVKL